MDLIIVVNPISWSGLHKLISVIGQI